MQLLSAAAVLMREKVIAEVRAAAVMLLIKVISESFCFTDIWRRIHLPESGSPGNVRVPGHRDSVPLPFPYQPASFETTTLPKSEVDCTSCFAVPLAMRSPVRYPSARVSETAFSIA